MFRRRDDANADSLFDAPADNLQGAPVESVTVVTPQPNAATPVSVSAGASTLTHVSSQPANPQPARPIQEAARPAGVQTASAFRPNASPISGDMTRNRMPEAKTSMAAGAASGAANVVAASASEKSNKSGRRVLTVGNDILLKGEIATCDRLVIEGKVDATLNDVHTVEIAESGSFKGSAQIEDAEISGIFDGDLVVRNRLVIYATGKVRGKITYGEIEIERGGELIGEIKTTAGQQASGRPATRAAGASAIKESKFEAA